MKDPSKTLFAGCADPSVRRFRSTDELSTPYNYVLGLALASQSD